MPQTGTIPETAELNLLRQWREPISSRRVLIDGVGSLLVHLAALGLLLAIPWRVPLEQGPTITADLRKSVPLYFPKELTQKDPNRGKVTQELDVRSAAPPAPVPQAPRFRPPEPHPIAANPVPQIEAPSIDAGIQAAPPPPPVGQPNQLPPPIEKPKLPFENIGANGPPRPNPNPNIKLPQTRLSPEELAKAGPLPPSSGGGVVIGDIDEMTTVPSPNQAPSAGPVRSNLQLLSDAQGFDFKPYLIQVLTAVRANWLAVIPESARMGRRGRVLVQFIIDRRGAVPKLVIAESSGTPAFDRAAVAGVSASYPFPPLPHDYKGDEIRLQLAFSYNVPAR